MTSRAEKDALFDAIALMGLRYVVITSVDRDDLKDGGGQHFANCIAAVRARTPEIRIEILTPDFRKRVAKALDAIGTAPPDVFNHNLETVPRLYRKARPGADYAESLDLIRQFKARHPAVPTKSGLMLGLGEELEEVRQVLRAKGEDRPGTEGTRVKLGQTAAGRFLRVIYAPEPESVFIITAYDLRGKALRAYRRRHRRKPR